MKAIAVVITLTAGSGAVFAQQPAADKPMAYETYCQMERTEKRAAFKSMPSEHRARLARTHVERWRDANKGRLSEAQLGLLKEMIAALTPAMYGGGSEADQRKARELGEALEGRADALFTNDERRALRYDAPCAGKDARLSAHNLFRAFSAFAHDSQ
jgi:hypothetical protein